MVKIISLLKENIEWCIIQKNKITLKKTLNSYKWDGKDFNFRVLRDGDLDFSGMQKKLHYDFNEDIKTYFLTKLALAIKTIEDNYPSTHCFIIVPTIWPEWIIQAFLAECRNLALQNIRLFRSSFLVVLLELMRKSKALPDDLKSLQLKSEIKYNDQLITVKNADDEEIDFDSICKIFLEYWILKRPMWKVMWPLKIGVYDHSKIWWFLLDEFTKLPFENYFCFQTLPKQQTNDYLNIIAKDSNGVEIEVLSIELPLNKTISPVQYSLKIEFPYTWNGKVVLRSGDDHIKSYQIHYPFLTYSQ